MKRNNTLVVSFFGGPGCSKSTFATGLFSELKWKGVNTELSMEYIKGKIYDEHKYMFSQQIYVFAKQHYSINKLLGKVDVVVTDSPYLLQCAYDKTDNKELQQLIVSEYKKLNTFNVFLCRDSSTYNPIGRNETLNEAKKVDLKIRNLLFDNNIPHIYVDSRKENINMILNEVLKKIDYKEQTCYT